MDRYVIVSSTKEQNSAVRASDALEGAGIPVIVQHKRKQSAFGDEPNYVLLVPDRYSSSATNIIKPLIQISGR